MVGLCSRDYCLALFVALRGLGGRLLDQVLELAVQLARVDAAVDDLARRVDQDHRRQGQNAHLVGQPAVESAGSNICGQGSRFCCRKLTRSPACCRGSRRSRRSPCRTCFHLLDLGHVGLGRLAPGGPILNQHDLALQLRQVDRFALGVLPLSAIDLPTESSRVIAPAAFLAAGVSGNFSRSSCASPWPFLPAPANSCATANCSSASAASGLFGFSVHKLFERVLPVRLDLREVGVRRLQALAVVGRQMAELHVRDQVLSGPSSFSFSTSFLSRSTPTGYSPALHRGANRVGQLLDPLRLVLVGRLVNHLLEDLGPGILQRGLLLRRVALSIASSVFSSSANSFWAASDGPPAAIFRHARQAFGPWKNRPAGELAIGLLGSDGQPRPAARRRPP